MTKFKNPANNYTEELSGYTWAWVLLFGTLYFLVKGVWKHAVLSFILAFCTFGLSWLIYPFFASEIMRKHYLEKGWVEVTE